MVAGAGAVLEHIAVRGNEDEGGEEADGRRIKLFPEKEKQEKEQTKSGKGRRQSHRHLAGAEQMESGSLQPDEQRGFGLPQVGLVFECFNQQVMGLVHFVGIHRIPGLVPFAQGFTVQVQEDREIDEGNESRQ